MEKESFLWKEVSVYSLTDEVKREIIILHDFGVTVDEISLFVSIKFGKKIELNELVDFLFSSV